MRSDEFKTLVLELNQALYRFAKSFLTNSQEAEDCVQEVFIKLWHKRASLSQVKNIKAFAMKMTRNLCLDKMKGRQYVMLEIEKETIATDLDPLRQLEGSDAMACVERIIALLPEQQRTVIHLRSIEGLEMEEIVEVTGMRIEHVRVTLSRARITIRQLYQKHYGQN